MASGTLKRLALRADGFQQRHVVLAFPIAVVKKFGDDQAGNLAALVAYYGFFAMFPLLLVLVSALELVLAGYPELREEIVSSALGQFPVVGQEIRERANLEALSGSWFSVAAGGAASLWAGLGVAQAAQRAMNVVWDIPRAEWPGFLARRGRALAMVLLLGSIIVVSTLVSGLGGSGFLLSTLVRAGGWAVSLLLNLALFTLAYEVLTARDLGWRDVLPGALVAAGAWTALQGVGGYYLRYQVGTATDTYGAFALVIGILVWIALGAQLTLLCAEINVVANRRLWPRSIVQPPLNDGDREVYRSIVRRSRMRPEVAVRVWFEEDGSSTTRRSGGERAR